MSACDECLRRSALLGLLASHIENEMGGSRRLPALLSLGDQELIEAVGGGKRSVIERRYSSFDAENARRKAADGGLGTVCRHESDFPAALLEAPDAPSMLYLRGDRGRLARVQSDPVVALVGSRRASPYGLEVAQSLGRELSACGVVVASGMAFGIDSAAHEGALDGGGLTVAVLGGGADVPYPRSKSGLYTRIVSEGLVMSEMPPGQSPFRWCFPARNRIMAALASMTIVVEGTDNSGSLITARFAADLGREVGAVPGQVTSSIANGPNGLLADGACMVRSAVDVLDAIYGPGSAAAQNAMAQAEPDLTDSLRSLLESIERGSDSPDAIASSPVEVPEVMAGLTELELMGLVRRGPDGRYIRCA
jgi:DNA processing protein